MSTRSEPPIAGARMPTLGLSPQVAPMGIGALLHELQRYRTDEAAKHIEYPWADRFVMGIPLAPWQREFKWTEAQCQRFINGIWTGMHLGTYVLTDFALRPEKDGFIGVEFEYLSNVVIDGQQRLKAIELFVEDRLAVPDQDGRLVLWSDVSVYDRRRFDKVIFSRGVIRERDEATLRQLYDLLNFGGTPHEERERALNVDEAAGARLLEPDSPVTALPRSPVAVVDSDTGEPPPPAVDACP